ncbi:MAG: UDP-N-acetylmuramoyl-tripeptide--D-alanyl-D-alanine ligase, partial [Elusimicrobiota bacterium]|nr:UDP-N-acetylmuramoyl-tripeptide--D-alanyl-D-alanine ligase [Elusimicrobiota bacterium]
MRNFYVKDILKSCNGQLISGRQDYPINNISIDSRTIQKGAFFFALKGANFDGHNFISQAVEKGAAGIIFENYENIPLDIAAIKVENTLTALGLAAKAYRRRFKNIKIAAITGSNGKTTTKEMLYSILSRKAKTAANKGNFNNQIGLPLSLFELDEDCKYAVFELGTSGFGEIDVLGSILSPNAAAITNIGYSHLESFDSPAGVFKEKVNLFKYIDRKGFAALNIDDVFLSRVERGGFYKSLTFAVSKEADVYANTFSFGESGSSFKLHYGAENIDIKIPQIGTCFIQDSVCAAAIAIGFGFSLSDIKEGLS